MGSCASKPKESDIIETSAVTENAVAESKNVETEVVSQVLWIKFHLVFIIRDIRFYPFFYVLGEKDV